MAMTERANTEMTRLTVDVPDEIAQRVDELTRAIAAKDWKRKGQSRMETLREILDTALPILEEDYGVADPLLPAGADDLEG